MAGAYPLGPVVVYLIGCALALGVWSLSALRAGQADRAASARGDAVHGAADAESLKPDPDSIWQGSFYGFICMGLMLMTGVSGPLMDTFFLGGNFDRREIVATKATCQVVSHSSS